MKFDPNRLPQHNHLLLNNHDRTRIYPVWLLDRRHRIASPSWNAWFLHIALRIQQRKSAIANVIDDEAWHLIADSGRGNFHRLVISLHARVLAFAESHYVEALAGSGEVVITLFAGAHA